MKLKNKISGEIKEFSLFDGKELQGGATLKSLTEEWEDVPEEPKEYWCIDWTEPGIYKTAYEDERDDFNREIGNYFETKEEAEKAVEKLKAWKRLKDKGLRFTSWEFRDVLEGDLVIEAKLNFDNTGSIQRDLEICFGGEE